MDDTSLAKLQAVREPFIPSPTRRQRLSEVWRFIFINKINVSSTIQQNEWFSEVWRLI